ncbi:hypothetical protein DSLASN_22380 [Desulfoluna limicola]|uniref:Beta-lactamase n=1 Tax=Desulfoluna limicola TaxID=2810562 RepID=A0ABM7PHP5_9BACT|nr:tetratricopeptide repeat protein [Desulfoluna limicola]BCS96606.1 hypothetical protein DSLASN_22380 [Desulfoluna limicola]
MRNRCGLFVCAFMLALASFTSTAVFAAEETGTFPEGYTQERYQQDKEKAEKGNAQAQFIMGYLHQLPVVAFVTPDSGKAFAWYQKAALQGHAQASQVLGLMYLKGDGVAADPVAAKRCYQYAADRGLVEAQFALAALYLEGQGGPQDYELAVFWFKRADKQNFPPASIALGNMCATGSGVPKDMKLAFAWFLRAAELGNGDAMLRVAGMYRFGSGVAKDVGIAIRWLEEALKEKNRASFVATNDLSWILATCADESYRDSKRALELAETLVQSGGTNPNALDTLAAAYAANGLFEKAIRAQEDAIEKLVEKGDTELVSSFRDRLELYKKGTAWIEP